MNLKAIYVVKAFGPSRFFGFGSNDVTFKKFEDRAAALKWAVGPAFKEFDNRTSRVELYETSAYAADSIEEVKTGRATLLGVQDPSKEINARLMKAIDLQNMHNL